MAYTVSFHDFTHDFAQTCFLDLTRLIAFTLVFLGQGLFAAAYGRQKIQNNRKQNAMVKSEAFPEIKETGLLPVQNQGNDRLTGKMKALVYYGPGKNPGKIKLNPWCWMQRMQL